MTVLMRTKIHTELGCVNVEVAEVSDTVFGSLMQYTASILVRDGAVLKYSIQYTGSQLRFCKANQWHHIKHNLLDGLMRTAFKEML